MNIVWDNACKTLLLWSPACVIWFYLFKKPLSHIQVTLAMLFYLILPYRISSNTGTWHTSLWSIKAKLPESVSCTNAKFYDMIDNFNAWVSNILPLDWKTWSIPIHHLLGVGHGKAPAITHLFSTRHGCNYCIPSFSQYHYFTSPSDGHQHTTKQNEGERFYFSILTWSYSLQLTAKNQWKKMTISRQAKQIFPPGYQDFTTISYVFLYFSKKNFPLNTKFPCKELPILLFCSSFAAENYCKTLKRSSLMPMHCTKARPAT